MAKHVHLDLAVYNQLLELLNNLHFTDKSGVLHDLTFLKNDCWLRDSAVIDHIVKRKGSWEVHLVFAYAHCPYVLLKRVITLAISHKRAVQMATYMRRLAAKDQRGTLKVKLEDFRICAN